MSTSPAEPATRTYASLRRLTSNATSFGKLGPAFGLFLALTLALIAASPFLTRPGLPRGTDAELHVFRAAELGYSLRAGDLYPRWAPDFYYGYGYPIFNYYAPLTYYLANLFQLAPGVDIVAGVKLVFVLGLIGSALGVYLFLRDWRGEEPALLAAALYVFSPYVLFVDPHARGVLAESFSLGLFPWALWTYRRLWIDGRGRWLVLAAVFQAALIMSHNLLGIVFTAILLAYPAWELVGTVIQRRRSPGVRQALARMWAPARRLSFALVLGLGLSAIFWLPLVMERADVQLVVTGPGHFDFRNHFLSLRELLSAPATLDLGAAAPRFVFNLGLPQWPLALLALPALVWSPPEWRRSLGFFLVISGGLVLLMLPISTPLWERMPGIEFLQFPWRLLGPAAAMLSITAGAGYAVVARPAVRWLGAWLRGRWDAVPLGFCVGLTLFLALPAMYPPLWDADFGPTDPSAMIAFELSGVAVGTTSTGDYLPRTVEMLPHPEPAFLATYASPEGPDKVNRASLPEGALVETLSRGPTYDVFRVDAQEPFVLRLFTHYFPGWQASVDGDQVPIELGLPEGFITVAVPAGPHTVEVRLGALATAPRRMGTLVSLLSFVIVILVGPTAHIVGKRRAASAANDAHSWVDPTASLRGDVRPWLVAGGVILVFLLFKVGLADRQHAWFRYTSPPGEVLGAQYSLAARMIQFGDSIQLLGFDLPKVQVRAGEILPLVLYWRATAPVQHNYQVFAHLTRPITHLWGQSDNLNPGEIPTSRWPLDKHVRDAHQLRVLPGTPPGDYQITVGLYTLADGARVPISDAGGQPVGDTFTLQVPVRVTLPHRPPDEAVLGLTETVHRVYRDQITLLGAVLPDRVIELPGFVHLALLWRAETDEPEDMIVRVQLVDTAGRVVDQVANSPVDGLYPASAWSAGQVVRDQYSLWLPQDFAPGTYELRIGIDGFGDWVSLGWIDAAGN